MPDGAGAVVAPRADRQEDLMSELKNKAEAEVEEFTDELSDEALDREGAERAQCGMCSSVWGIGR